MSINWKSNTEQFRKRKCYSVSVTEHPLKTLTVRYVSNLNSKTEQDPLSAALEGTDPLSIFAKDAASPSININERTEKDKQHWSEVWNARRSSILIHFTTSEKLSIVTSFLPGGEKMIVKNQTSTSDHVKTRLDQLDDFEEGSIRQMLDLSQQEYVTRIDMLNRELVQAWNSEQRVKALKIAIQCSKLLADTNVIQFYPSKFVLITDILDIFGKLVYDRLRLKAEYYSSGSSVRTSLPENFTPDMVSESAKETCQNWLYKMASIRELLPRLYIEMSLLKCYSFLTRDEFGTALQRLSTMIRGIGHPLVAAYARFYLCRVGLSINMPNKEYFLNNVNDFLLIYSQIHSNGLRLEMDNKKVPFNIYVNLYSPALDWMLYGLVHWGNATEATLDKLLFHCKQLPSRTLFLHSIISSFHPDYISTHALELIELINKCQNEEDFVTEMLMSLGNCVCTSAANNNMKPLLVAAWQVIANLQSLRNYLIAVAPWLQYTIIHFPMHQANILIFEVIRHVQRSVQNVEDLYPQLQNVLNKIMNNIEDSESFFVMDSFLPLLDLFQSTPIRVDITKFLLESFYSKTEAVIKDSLLISVLMQLCRILHDSVDAMTVEDELKIISDLVAVFIRSVTYGDDYEQQLTFYVDSRGAFPNLDSALITLVHAVNTLSINARCSPSKNSKTHKKSQTNRASWFSHACSAFCFVTIPSVSCAMMRAQLYLLSGKVSLFNQCPGQAEACFKASISLLPEMPAKRALDGQLKSNNIYLQSFVSDFFSTLLVIPDAPDAVSPLYLLKGLLKGIKRLSMEETNPAYYVLLLRTLDLLHNMAQEDYAYHMQQVDANDALYGCDEIFIEEINKICKFVVDDILSALKQLSTNNELRKQSSLALELFWRIIRRSDMREPALEGLAMNLWLLAHKRKDSADQKLSKKMLNSLIKDGEKTARFANIIPKLSENSNY